MAIKFLFEEKKVTRYGKKYATLPKVAFNLCLKHWANVFSLPKKDQSFESENQKKFQFAV